MAASGEVPGITVAWGDAYMGDVYRGETGGLGGTKGGCIYVGEGEERRRGVRVV